MGVTVSVCLNLCSTVKVHSARLIYNQVIVLCLYDHGNGNAELGFLKHSSIVRKWSGLRSPGMKLLLQCVGTVKLNCTKHMLLA